MDNSTDSPEPFTTKDRRLIIFWSIGMSAFFLLLGILIFVRVRQNKLAENARVQALIESPVFPVGAAYDLAPPSGQEAVPVDVQVGVFVNQIPEFSLRNFLWKADLLVWFEWTGDAPDPGESFEIFDGEILLKEKISETVDGDTHYTRYHVVAEINQFFDVARFPLNEFIPTIGIIDIRRPVYQLRFVADEQNSGVSPRLRVMEGVAVSETLSLVKLYPYPTSFGDPSLPPDYNTTFSTYFFAIRLTSPGLAYYLKLFLALYISVLVSISVFFIKPVDVDPRFGLGVGALFAAVANTYLISSLLPPSGGMVMADTINAVGITVIFLTVIQSILSLYLYDVKEKQALSRQLDRVSFIIFLVGFLAINLGMTVAALV